MKLTAFVLFIIIGLRVAAQSDHIPLHSKQYDLLNRLEIITQSDATSIFTTVKPYNRRLITEYVEKLDSVSEMNRGTMRLSSVDQYNLGRLLMNNTEWVNADHNMAARKPVLKKFYRNPAHFAVKKTDDLFFTADPILYQSIGKANDGSGTLYQNTRGICLRGNIDQRIGYYSYITENQERDPLYVRNYVKTHNALPGEGYFKHFGTNGYDYFEGRGGISFNGGKHFDFTFAYDKLFIGNGYRSLFLSDFSNNYLFLRIQTHFRKLQYQNTFAELIAPFVPGNDYERPKKYLAAHHLSIQAKKWLNIGFFENIMFYRPQRGFELSYLNPVIFYRSMEQQLGSPDKAMTGFDMRMNFKNNIQLYGQLLINEFKANEILHYNRGSWLNKQAIQLGAKYMDAFKVHNLDLQAEMNIVRPFTYSHRDSTTSFSHYNMPLAHPLGAGFREFIFNLNYQPLPKWRLNAKLITWKQGLDSAEYNFGSDIFREYTNKRPRDYGFFIGTGTPLKAMYGSVTATYELFENMFIDANVLFRSYNVKGSPDQKLNAFSLAFRMNIARREFDF